MILRPSLLLAFFLFQLTSFSQDIIPITSELDGSVIGFQVPTRHGGDSPESLLREYGILTKEMGLLPSAEPITDKIGQTHQRYSQTYKGLPIFGATIAIHSDVDGIMSISGRFADSADSPSNDHAVISPARALELAMDHIGADHYMWESQEMEDFLKKEQDNEHSSFVPEAKEVYLPSKWPSLDGGLRLAYQLDIYASHPISRQDVFIDAETGEVLFEHERIHHIDEVGTASTAYYGTQSIITYRNSTTSPYELRDMSRGGGIHTYDCFDTDNYAGAQIPTSTTNDWLFPSLDASAILDAHYCTEQTYDFYLAQGWESYDNANSPLYSYVHFSLIDYGYPSNNNAFWDGSRMTYGDGDGIIFNPLTAVDVVGHEITHGVTENSAGLVYAYESGALNESYSDIFGACVEYYANPGGFSWLLGNDMSVTGSAFRSMSNPNQFNDPDTYLGDYWWTSSGDNGGVHTNSGVQNFWFYLLSDGGSGVNDIGDSFSVNGIGIQSAAAIAFRTLTVYLNSSSDHADARTYSIASAIDLYGDCSDEVIAVTNAWYAVGVGGLYDNAVVADFQPSRNYSCLVPATVAFSNSSINSSSYIWDFGDGATSTLSDPGHTYTSAGTYIVSLVSSGNSTCNTTDTLFSAPIVIEDGAGLIAADCSPSVSTATSVLFDQVDFSSITSNGIDALTYVDLSCDYITTVTEGEQMSISISLSSFGHCAVYLDGDNDGQFSFDEQIVSTSEAALLHDLDLIVPGVDVFDTPLRFRLISRADAIIDACSAGNGGQVVDYAIGVMENMLPPVAGFDLSQATVLPGEVVQITDMSLNVPTSWTWNLSGSSIGSSTSQDVMVTYPLLGSYDVELIVANAFGADTLTVPDAIQVIETFDLCDIDESSAVAGTFFDPGGTGNYSNGEFCTLLISPACAESITLSFSSFDTENCCDRLRIYDGNDANAIELANYGGSNIPPSVTATSGQMFIQWSSDGSVTDPGFEAHWVAMTSSSDTLHAVAQVSESIPGFGETIQFSDASVEDPSSWFWDFGDGAISTEQAPQHAYLSSGPKTVTLFAQNCSFSDTDTLYLDVQEPGGISIDPTEFDLAIEQCADSVQASLTIHNIGSGEMTYTTGSSELTDDFEGTVANPDIWAEVTGEIADLCGTNSGSGALYFDADDQRHATTVPLNLSSGAQLSFYLHYGTWSSPCEEVDFNEHVLVEYSFNGVDYTTIQEMNTLFDYWNYTQVVVDIPQEAAGQATIYRIRQLSFSGSGTDNWSIDDVAITGLSDPNIELDPSSATIAPGDSLVASMSVYRNGRVAGTYQSVVELYTTIPTTPLVVVPVDLIVSGDGVLENESDCLQFPTIQENTSQVDSLWLYNNGCAPLNLTSFSIAEAEFQTDFPGTVLAPNDSIYVRITYSPTLLGTHSGDLEFSSDGQMQSICLSGEATGSAVISVDPTELTLSGEDCPDQLVTSFYVINTGSAALNWDVQTSTTEDFEGSSPSADFILSTTGLNSSGCGPFNGERSHRFAGPGDRSLVTSPFLIDSNTQFSFYLKYGSGGGCELVDGNEYIVLEYSTNGFNWNVYSSLTPVNSYYEWGLVDIPLPVEAYGANNQIRLRQYSPDGNEFDVFMIDDLTVNAATYSDIVSSPETAQTAIGDSTLVTLTIDTDQLDAGTYTDQLTIQSDDPVSPTIIVPLTFEVDGDPLLAYNGPSCLDLEPIFIGLEVLDSLFIENAGCAPMTIGSAVSSNSDLDVLSFPSTLESGQGAWVHISFGPAMTDLYDETIAFTSNGGDLSVCIQGEGLAAPSVEVDPGFLVVEFTSCDEVITVDLELSNPGGSDLDYSITSAASDGLDLAEIRDLWLEGHQDVTGLIPDPFSFTNGEFGDYIADGGSDMYDTGNRLQTNYYFQIPYSQNTISNNAFGTNGSYFTSKVDNMFLLAAKMDDVSYFEVYGNLGQDGSGEQDHIQMTYNTGSTSYTGYGKRIFGSFNPSVNHLIITETDPDIVEFSYPTPSYEDQELQGLDSNQWIFYLLFSSESGGYVSDEEMGDIMEAFMDMIHPSPFLTGLTPEAGTVGTNSSDVIQLEFTNEESESGTYNMVVGIESNDPLNPTVDVPVIVNVPNIPCADASYTYENGCAGEVGFENISVNDDNGPWLWDFGDGSTSNEEDPLHIYEETGFYTVTFTVGSGLLQSTHTFEVFAQAVTASFIHSDPETDGGTVQFASTSPAAVGHLWDFGDGGSSTLSSPVHTYGQFGTYVVSLQVEDEDGCAGITSAIVEYGVNGVDEILLEGVEVFPNPTSGTVQLELSGISTAVSAIITDATGRIVSEPGQFGAGLHTISIEDLADGVYTLRLDSPQGGRSIRLVKQR